ncbi:MAG: sulfurtransferase [Burkholderiaceae bacterium]
MTNYRTLISAEQLAEQIDHCLVIDCRHNLAAPQAGREAYAVGHIPNAFFLHLDDDLSSPQSGDNGRHPLPAPAKLASKLSSLGLKPGVQLVAYDDAGGMVASRLWWMARWLGHETVAVLDGGIKAWTAAGFPVNADTRDPTPAASDWATPGQCPTTDANAILANIDSAGALVIDARAGERFRGETEPLDKRAGHIPGAVNRPFADNLREDGRFKPAAVLRSEFLAITKGFAPDQLIHSCGSGVSACHNLLAMAYAELDGSQLYPGSWSEWSSRENLPVATGEAG